ncbi:MAG TPA: hypothetical protein VIY68_03915 [Steroidobacteraceae bacterium]
MPLRQFLFCSLTVSTIYLGALATLGYGFARAYGVFQPSLASANIYLAIPGVAILCALGYVTVLMRRRLRPQAEQHSNLIKRRRRRRSGPHHKHYICKGKDGRADDRSATSGSVPLSDQARSLALRECVRCTALWSTLAPKCQTL